MSQHSEGLPLSLKPARWRKLVEVLVVVASIAVLIALFAPEARWVADGSAEFPVKVFVFDVTTGTPIPDANVAVISRHGLPHAGSFALTPDAIEAAKDFVSLSEHLDFAPANQKCRTNNQGVGMIQADVFTSSSNRHPKPRALPSRCWVVVTATGYGGAVIPLGQEPILTSELRERGGFHVPIGIMQDK